MLIYVNSQYEMLEQQRERLVMPIIQKLVSQGHTVVEAMTYANQQIDFNDPSWLFELRKLSKQAIVNCDAMLTIITGLLSDEDVLIGMGMAIAMNKPIYLFMDNRNKVTDNTKYPLNLLGFTDTPMSLWRGHYFTSVDEINISSEWRVK